jgi:putative PEP-CTERM system TPR-repeat lipoprotein
MSRYVVCAGLLGALLVASCGRIDPKTELATATARFEAKDYAEAGIRVSNVVQVQPDNPEARRLRAEIAIAIGDYTTALADFERAQALGVAPSAIAPGEAEALVVARQPDKALAVLDAARPTGKDPRYWVTRAEALLAAGRTAEAEQALENTEPGPRATIVRARIAFQRNDLVGAERELVGSGSSDPAILTARAELFARTQRLPEAAAALQGAADMYHASHLTTREVMALLSLVQVQLAANDLEAAEVTARRLAQAAPQAALTSYMKGLVEYRRGRFDEAAALIQPLVGSSPDTVQFRALLGAIQLARGNFGQAEQQLQAVLATSPGDPAAIKLLAETHLRQQRPEAALATLRGVADTAAEDPQIGMLSGVASVLAGDTRQGLLYLQQAASLDPGNEALKLELARAYLLAGRDSDASALLKDALGGGPAALEAGMLKLMAHVRNGTADDAAAQDLLAQFPEDSRALTAVAIYTQFRGDDTRARELFERAAKLETSGSTARMLVAATWVREGRTREAEDLLSGLVQQKPDNVRALTGLAELLAARNEFDAAARYLQQAAERSQSIAPRLALAQLRIRQGDLVAARREVDTAARLAPDSPEVAAVRGLLALGEGRPSEAATLLRQASAKLPDRLGITLALGRAELAAGQAESARDVLRKMLPSAPKSLPLRFVLGEAELRLGNAGEAASIATELKAEYPAQSAGYVLDAEVRTAARQYGAAADSLAAAFEREPSWAVMARLVEARQLAGQPAEALKATEQWLTANPRHVPGLLLRATLLQNAGQDAAALAGFESVLALDHDNLVALNNAAWLSQRLGRPGALALAEQANAIRADNPAVLDTLGFILLNGDRPADAVGHLRRAAELAPSNPEIHYHLAEALVKTGQAAEARSVLGKVLARGADFEQRAAAQKLYDSL